MNTFQFSVRGVTFDGRQNVIANLSGREPVRVVPEPENKFDKNALAIIVAVNGGVFHLGYVPKERALEIAPYLDGESVDGRIIAITRALAKNNGQLASYGVLVEFEFPDATDDLTNTDSIWREAEEYSNKDISEDLGDMPPF